MLQNETGVPHLSVVIPAYNEEERISTSLQAIGGYLGDQSYTYEVLVVDDGSTDRTIEICRAFASEHGWPKALHYPVNHGKGFAVREGVLNSAGEHVLMCDADLATPIEELDGFWQFLEEGADIVIASLSLIHI